MQTHRPGDRIAAHAGLESAIPLRHQVNFPRGSRHLNAIMPEVLSREVPRFLSGQIEEKSQRDPFVPRGASLAKFFEIFVAHLVRFVKFTHFLTARSSLLRLNEHARLRKKD